MTLAPREKACSPCMRGTPDMDMGCAQNKRRSSGGFTLIELLAVIAIVAILAALLVPGIAKGQRRANAADSMSNLRQIVAASMLFAGDHDGRFHNGWSFEQQLGPYLVNYRDERTLYVSRNADRQPRVAGATFPITYSVHGRMMFNSEDNPDLGQPASRMRNPGRLILVGDGIQAPNNFWQANWHIQNPAAYVFGNYDSFSEADLATPLENNAGPRGVGPDESSGNAGWFRYCNDGAVAAAFGDGHAELIRKGSVVAGNLVAF